MVALDLIYIGYRSFRTTAGVVEGAGHWLPGGASRPSNASTVTVPDRKGLCQAQPEASCGAGNERSAARGPVAGRAAWAFGRIAVLRFGRRVFSDLRRSVARNP